MRKLIANIKKPTPAKWRTKGNYAMLLLMALTLVSDDLDNAPLSEPAIYWTKKAIAILLIFFKAYAETKVDKTIYTGDQS